MSKWKKDIGLTAKDRLREVRKFREKRKKRREAQSSNPDLDGIPKEKPSKGSRMEGDRFGGFFDLDIYISYRAHQCKKSD